MAAHAKQMDSVYSFHQASIHERRFLARFCAAVPLLFLVSFVAIVAYGTFHKPIVLLVTSAIMNIVAWFWISSTAILSIIGVAFCHEALQTCQKQHPTLPIAGDVEQNGIGGCPDAVDKVVNMIVLPNFKEEEAMLTETLYSLGEAKESKDFCIVLGMEEREIGSQQKGERLKELFRHTFANVIVTIHPVDLHETHLDGSEDPEAPGKASNLKWAVAQGFAEFQRKTLHKSLSNVIVTVADADCIFHPDYFNTVTKEFNMLREKPGSDHLWTMWQAPQLPYRNFYRTAACSRIWGYISSVYETGGVCRLSFGGTHMVFSSYSLPLQLAVDAGAWDGDVIAEDHHAFLKCFFYSARSAAEDSLAFGSNCVPRLNVRPVYLPVKSTSVSAESYCKTWVERWHQARRHAQGVAELSYACLAACDAFLTLPWRLHSFSLCWQVSQVVARLWCMHLLPMCQAISLGALTMVWLYHGQELHICHAEPAWGRLTHMTLAELQHHMLCGTAGAWVLMWPMAIPTILVIIANYLFLKVVFMRGSDSKQAESIWHAEDGGARHVLLQRGCFSQCLTTVGTIAFDCVFLLSVVMIPYGFLAEVAAYISVARNGNKLTYHTAAKPLTSPMNYGAMAMSTAKLLDEPGSPRSLAPSLPDSGTHTPSGEHSSSSSRERSPSLTLDGASSSSSVRARSPSPASGEFSGAKADSSFLDPNVPWY